MSQYTGQKRTSALDGTDGFVAPPSGATSHLPGFVSKVPWYLKDRSESTSTKPDRFQPREEVESSASLVHQKSITEKRVLEDTNLAAPKGSLGDAKVKFMKGACENCGSTTHKRRDCLERPRKVLAKYSNAKLASDDVLPADVDRGTFEAKRDRWRVFPGHPSAESSVGEREAKVDKLAGIIKITGEQLKVDEASKFDVVSSMRVREDTAKYLLDLSEGNDKGYYDPKSRSLRGPSGGQFEKASDPTMAVRQVAWESNLNEIANPTKVATLVRKESEEAQKKVEERRKLLQASYGQSQ